MVKKITSLAIFILCTGYFMSCSSLEPKDFADVKPTFSPEKFFEGRAEAWGVLEDSSGNPTKRFTSVDIGTLHGDTVTISQTITYSDGEVQKRSWNLKRLDEHHYEGTADDIVDKAEGEAYGNTLMLDYSIALSPSNPFTHLHLRQWLYLQSDGKSMISRTTISKLGKVLARTAEYVTRVNP